MKFEASIEGENVIIPKKVFEYMITSRQKEKQIAHLGGKIWDDLQEKINEFWLQCENILKNERANTPANRV
jgi:hypothetical protein